MKVRIASRVRHPFFPGLRLTPAVKAMGVCAALSGTFEELVSAREVGVRAESAVFPVVRVDGAGLDTRERDRLWDLFQVPVYALRVDAEGRLQAFECEAQDGMHVAKGAAAGGTVDETPCECGRPGVRLMA